MGNIAHLKKVPIDKHILQSHDYTMILIKRRIYKCEKLTEGWRTTGDQKSSLELEKKFLKSEELTVQERNKLRLWEGNCQQSKGILNSSMFILHSA